MDPRLPGLLAKAREKLKRVEEDLAKGMIPLISAFDLEMAANQIEEILADLEYQEAIKYIEEGEQRCPRKRRSPTP